MSIVKKIKKAASGAATVGLGSLYVHYYKKNRVDEHTVFYCSHYGTGMVCSPYAIFRTLLASEDFGSYTHIWQINDPEERALLAEEYAAYDNVKFVGKNSVGYFNAITSAKYLIINVTLPFYFTKKPEQVFVNTWHGIPLKTLGYDTPDGKYSVRNTMHNLLQTDWIVSPCRFTTKIFLDSYKLRGIYAGQMTECGHPRCDLLRHTRRDEILGKLAARGTEVDESRKIILYAPTWKGAGGDVEKAVNDIARYDEFCDFLTSHIDTEQYQILIKPHPAVYRQLTREQKESGQYVSQCIDTDELLSITDILVSDYSSLFFDFLLTDRPVFFYIPDVETYRKERGVYFALDELPGPYSGDMGDIADWINDAEAVRNRYRAPYEKMKAWACECDDGKVCERVVDAVFRGDVSARRPVRDMGTDKKKLLINGGSFAMNGVTTTLLTLLRLLDYDTFDVTLLIVDDDRSMPNIMQVDDRVRVLCRCGQIPFGAGELVQHRRIIQHGVDEALYHKLLTEGAYHRNYTRCFGDSRFDAVIDYSGYGVTQPLTLMQCEGATRIIWQHNDLYRDLTNKAKRRTKAYRRKSATTLEALLTLYRVFDKVVSCSEGAMEVNRHHLAASDTYSKFTFVTNTLNVERIRTSVAAARYEDGQFIDAPQTEREKAVPAPEEGNVNFVTMGRFSPEKNHLALIEGFARLCGERPRCRLYIIGDGALREAYEQKIAELGVTEQVILTGQLDNPFGIMQRCGCFILPSHYEGMPMVIYEARALGMAIIMSEFSTAASVCIPDGQMVVGHSGDALYEAMKAFADGDFQADYTFDADALNRKALAEFENVVG